MTPTRVTLLTQADCAFCEQAKEILARLERDHPLTVEEIDLATPAGRARRARRGPVAPGLLLDGAPFSYGRLSERRLRRALRRVSAPT
jgi:glutaredoxin